MSPGARAIFKTTNINKNWRKSLLDQEKLTEIDHEFLLDGLLYIGANKAQREKLSQELKKLQNETSRRSIQLSDKLGSADYNDKYALAKILNPQTRIEDKLELALYLNFRSQIGTNFKDFLHDVDKVVQYINMWVLYRMNPKDIKELITFKTPMPYSFIIHVKEVLKVRNLDTTYLDRYIKDANALRKVTTNRKKILEIINENSPDITDSHTAFRVNLDDILYNIIGKKVDSINKLLDKNVLNVFSMSKPLNTIAKANYQIVQSYVEMLFNNYPAMLRYGIDLLENPVVVKHFQENKEFKEFVLGLLE